MKQMFNTLDVSIRAVILSRGGPTSVQVAEGHPGGQVRGWAPTQAWGSACSHQRTTS